MPDKIIDKVAKLKIKSKMTSCSKVMNKNMIRVAITTKGNRYHYCPALYWGFK